MEPFPGKNGTRIVLGTSGKAMLAGLLLLAHAGAQQAVVAGTINIGNAGGTPGMRLGDLDGDGKMEIVIGQPLPQPDAHTPQEVVRVTAFSLTGTKLWQYTRPGNPDLTGHGASSDIPIQVYDFDGDGDADVIAATSGKELSFIDGRTGTLVRTIPLPQGQSANGPSGSSDCILIANLRGTAWPQDFIVKTRYTQVWGINGETGAVLWTHKGSGDNLAHYGYVFNADADPMDEYLSGWQLLDHDGKVKWAAKGLTMHIDAASVGDVDGNPANGLEIAMGSQIGALYSANTGAEIWRDNHVTANGQGIQQIAIGDFSDKHPGKEVVMLERIGPRDNTGRDANILVTAGGQLIWKENRTGNDYGWVSTTERITNWDGTGKDQILTYRRTSKPPEIYDGDGKVIATFPHSGSYIEFLVHADVCGDNKEEVIVYHNTTAWIFSHGGCDLAAPARQAKLPQQRRMYNWSIYTGWDAPDYSFYTPGATPVKGAVTTSYDLTIRPSAGSVAFRGLGHAAQLRIFTPSGALVAESGPVRGGEWVWASGSRKGLYILKTGDEGARIRKFVLR